MFKKETHCEKLSDRFIIEWTIICCICTSVLTKRAECKHVKCADLHKSQRSKQKVDLVSFGLNYKTHLNTF